MMVSAQFLLALQDTEDGMAKKRASKSRRAPAPTPPPAPAPRPGVTPERFSRLWKMLHFLGNVPRTREWLTGKLKLDVRGFYRDLELLRSAGISITLGEDGYKLGETIEGAVARLPFPDPHLTLGEVRQLARGRTQAHRRLKEQIDELQA
jgi:hypothetical protein